MPFLLHSPAGRGTLGPCAPPLPESWLWTSDLLNLAPSICSQISLGQKLNSSLPTGSLWFVTFYCSEKLSQADAMSQNSLCHQSRSCLAVFSPLHFLGWFFSVHCIFLLFHHEFICQLVIFTPSLFPGEVSFPCWQLKDVGCGNRTVFHSWKGHLTLGGWGGAFVSAVPLHSELEMCHFSLGLKMKLVKYKSSLMSSDGAGSAFPWDICQCILLPHLRASRFHLNKAFIKFTNSFHAGSSISRCGRAVAADPLCTQTGPRGRGSLTSPVGWELRNTNHFQVIWKYLCYILHFLLVVFLYESGWNQRQLQLEVIRDNFLSNLAAVCAARNQPVFLNPSTVTLSGTNTALEALTAAFPL